MKQNLKFILGIIIGVVLSGITVYAATIINSSDVAFNNTNGMKSTNVQDAIDELYDMKSKLDSDNKVVSVGMRGACATDYYINEFFTNGMYASTSGDSVTIKETGKYLIKMGNFGHRCNNTEYYSTAQLLVNNAVKLTITTNNNGDGVPYPTASSNNYNLNAGDVIKVVGHAYTGCSCGITFFEMVKVD